MKTLIATFAAAVAVAALAAPYLTWEPGSGSITGYRIYYGEASNSYPQYRQIGNVTEYPLANLPLKDNTTYYFRVKAYNSATESGPTNEASFTTSDNTPPPPPASLSATGTTLTWEASSGAFLPMGRRSVGKRLQRRMSADTWSTMANTLGIMTRPSPSGMSRAIKYLD